jgi:hypothetical protein
MYIRASGCLLKKIVWVHINSKWSAVILAFIISWSEVMIRGIESPVAFEVGVQWVFPSVAVTRAGVFANLWNKIDKILKIFEQLDYLRNWWVLCQH